MGGGFFREGVRIGGLGRDGGWLPTGRIRIFPQLPKGDFWTLYKVERFTFMFMSRIRRYSVLSVILAVLPRVYLVAMDGWILIKSVPVVQDLQVPDGSARRC